ncbi:hypothetical protein MA16_Dca026577 [Dendrobium catenatum]|uniref:Uncharacterized protein n=1 Tax=Dendrobium catenatum TaxID=906689 RepID=A0A2I0VXA0_9ASPA|nr:hypothetical protein MA16_Dca026577 [Dendrobium catenatum]
MAKSEGSTSGKSLTSVGGKRELRLHLGGVSASGGNSVANWEEFQHHVEVGKNSCVLPNITQNPGVFGRQKELRRWSRRRGFSFSSFSYSSLLLLSLHLSPPLLFWKNEPFFIISGLVRDVHGLYKIWTVDLKINGPDRVISRLEQTARCAPLLRSPSSQILTVHLVRRMIGRSRTFADADKWKPRGFHARAPFDRCRTFCWTNQIAPSVPPASPFLYN